MNDVVLGNDENTAPLLDPTKCVDLIQKGAYGTFNINQNTEIKQWNENTSNPPESLVSRAQRCLQIGIRLIIIVQLSFHFVDRAYRGRILVQVTIMVKYIVGFWLVEMAISTNQKPTIYRNLY